MLRFAFDCGAPTSNQAERDLRPAKTQQNISGWLTSSSTHRRPLPHPRVHLTAVKHGSNALDVLRQTFTGRP